MWVEPNCFSENTGAYCIQTAVHCWRFIPGLTVSTIYQHVLKYEQLNILLLITSQKRPSTDLSIMVIYSAYIQINFLSYINWIR